MTYSSVQDNADRAEACANAECVHAQNGQRAARIAQEYRYGVEEALDYLDDRDGITAEAAEALRGILRRAIETPAPTA
jgi:hypothetical protein